MKPCHNCAEVPSVIELTQIENGEVTKVPLCAKCAAEKGIQTVAAHTDTPLGSLIAALGGENLVSPGLVVDSEQACPSCGATLEDFRQAGRLGCEFCYTEFAEPLRELLRRLHGSTTHCGKIGSGTVGPVQPPAEAAQLLRDRLRRAIAAEQFELAAELRDRLKGPG